MDHFRKVLKPLSWKNFKIILKMWIMDHANHAKVDNKECVGLSTFLASKIPWEREMEINTLTTLWQQ